MGPNGFIFFKWRSLAQASLTTTEYYANFVELLPIHNGEAVAAIMLSEPTKGNAVQLATKAMKNILKVLPREETIALQLADMILSKELGWKFMTPMISCTISGAQIRSFNAENSKVGDLAVIIHNAIAKSTRETIHLAHGLARRAARLRAVAPKLRAKGADKAVELFLSEDAVSPSRMLSPKIKGSTISMTDRSARRLCDRLVELGVVRELTGRSTYRFYGV
jgi:hypothetical protein